MNRWHKDRWELFWVVWGIMAIAALVHGQTPAPTLSTADKTALTDAEKAKQQAQLDFNKAQELELQVMREWESAHPGWKINPQNFSIARDEKASATAAPAPHAPAGAAPKRSESTPQPPRK